MDNLEKLATYTIKNGQSRETGNIGYTYNYTGKIVKIHEEIWKKERKKLFRIVTIDYKSCYQYISTINTPDYKSCYQYISTINTHDYKNCYQYISTINTHDYKNCYQYISTINTHHTTLHSQCQFKNRNKSTIPTDITIVSFFTYVWSIFE
jgi:hypothetical protein